MEQIVLIEQRDAGTEDSRREACKQLAELGEKLKALHGSKTIFAPPSRREVGKFMAEAIAAGFVEHKLLSFESSFVGQFLSPNNIFELLQSETEVEVCDNIIWPGPRILDTKVDKKYHCAMVNKKGHRIANEVKADIIRRVKEEGISVSQAAKDRGIHESTIYGWLGAGAVSAPSWGEFSRLQKQNKELFEVIGELTIKLSQAQKKN